MHSKPGCVLCYLFLLMADPSLKVGQEGFNTKACIVGIMTAEHTLDSLGFFLRNNDSV